MILNCLFVAYKGDIICLQEVESIFFNRELSPLLNHSMAMNGHFLKKNSREGLSCFYSSEKFVYVHIFLLLSLLKFKKFKLFLICFSLLEEFNIKLNNLDTMQNYCESILKHIINHEFWKPILEKKTVLQVCKFGFTVYSELTEINTNSSINSIQVLF